MASLRAHIAVALAAAGLAAAAIPAAVHAADPAPRAPRIAVVDLQRAVMETEDGLRAQSTLRKFFERRQLEMNMRQEELVKKKEDIEKQSKLLSKEAIQRALEEWQGQYDGLQAAYAEYERDRGRRQNEVTAPIYGRVTGLLRKLAQREGYDMVLDRQVVPYAKSDLDLTDQLILMYNNNEEPAATASGAPSASAAPAAPPASAPPAASKQ
jgi:outer membrane protein